MKEQSGSWLQKRNKKKWLEKLNERTAPLGNPPAEFVFMGRAPFQWTNTMTVLATMFAAAFAFAITQGVVLFPGGILAVILYHSAKPPRLASVGDGHVSIWSQSMWANGPKDLLAIVHPHEVQFGHDRDVTIGSVPMKLSESEWSALSAATIRANTQGAHPEFA
jgi:hypothetical protein